LAEQQATVARLDGIAERIANLRKVSAQTEADLQSALRTTFEEIVVDAPRARMKDVAPLVRRPVEVDMESEYPELGVRSFGKGTFHKPSLSGIAVGSKRLFTIKEGDLVFNIVFAWEGAVAVARPEDDGRVGSHRFLTCFPDSSQVFAEFLNFYFGTPEGLQQIGEASPGGAGRNRTLGLKALETINVPCPSIESQRWFNELQAKAGHIRRLLAEADHEAQALIPSMLNEIFSVAAPESRL
jgi:type I restriction enzyme S subunit